MEQSCQDMQVPNHGSWDNHNNKLGLVQAQVLQLTVTEMLREAMILRQGCIQCLGTLHPKRETKIPQSYGHSELTRVLHQASCQKCQGHSSLRAHCGQNVQDVATGTTQEQNQITTIAGNAVKQSCVTSASIAWSANRMIH